MNTSLELCAETIHQYYIENNFLLLQADIEQFLKEMTKLFNFRLDDWIVKFISLKHPLKIQIETVQRSTLYVDNGEEDYTIINDVPLFQEENTIKIFQSFLFGDYEIYYCLYAKAKILFISLPEKKR